MSPVLYLSAIVVELRSARVADAVFVAVALLWLIPDRRIENVSPNNFRITSPIAVETRQHNSGCPAL